MINKLYVLILLVFLSCDLGWKYKEIPKIVDHLDLDFKSDVLITHLDKLETTINKFPDSIKTKPEFIGFGDSGISINRIHIDSSDMSIEFINEKVELSRRMEENEIQNIIDLFYLLERNDISMGAFQKNYACNNATFFRYRLRYLMETGNNYRDFQRRIFIKRKGKGFIDCGFLNYEVIDSIGSIYLLKDKSL